jgi:hypothetical protein
MLDASLQIRDSSACNPGEAGGDDFIILQLYRPVALSQTLVFPILTSCTPFPGIVTPLERATRPRAVKL